MQNDDKYYIFEVEDEGKYLFGPTHFNDNPDYPYNELKLWRFYNDNYELHLLQCKKQILIAYGKSEQLTKVLISKGANFKEHKVEAIVNNGEKLKLENNFLLKLEKQWSYAYLLSGSKNYNDTFFSFYHGTDSSTELPNIDPLEIHNKKVSLISQGSLQPDGSPPTEIEPYLIANKKKEEESSKNGLMTFLIFIAIILLFIFGINNCTNGEISF